MFFDEIHGLTFFGNNFTTSTTSVTRNSCSFNTVCNPPLPGVIVGTGVGDGAVASGDVAAAAPAG